MDHSVEDDGTYLWLGDTNTSLSLLFTDQALLNFTKRAQQASREMVRARHQPVPDWLGHELR
jgi:hypothetical protein